jgi:glycerophosphoryl diester phosphodiesterase
LNRPSGGAVRSRLGAAAISAHRGGGEGAPAGTSEAYRAAPATGAEYAEFDIRRTADMQLVAYHDAAAGSGQALADISYARLCELAGQAVPLVADVMRLIAGKAIGHLDLKETGGEDVIIELALEILGPGNFVATTLEDASVAAIKGRFPGVPVALSLGRDLTGMPWPRRLAARRRELFPLGRIRACGADWAAMHHRLARAGVLRRCHRAGISTMVWTVNGDKAITRWLADPRVDVVVTDRPRHAAALRERLRRTAK